MQKPPYERFRQFSLLGEEAGCNPQGQFLWLWGFFVFGELILKTRFFILLLTVFMFLSSSVIADLFIDDIGRTVSVSNRPQRIISLAPNITEILFYLDLGNKVIAVTDFCNYPEGAKKKPSVGLLLSPDIEKIVSLKPDLIFATAEGNREDIVSNLQRFNMNVYVLNPHSMEDVLREIQRIGNITGQDGIARDKVKNLTNRIDAVKKKVAGSRRVRVLYLVSNEPMISVGPGSFIHDIIEIAGGKNIFSQSPIRYPHVNMEEILSKDPEVIIAPPDVAESIRSWEKRWGDISAIRNKRVYSIETDIISRPGPRIVDGMEEIFKFIYKMSP
jgi:iron complex transport system substrate-binding protein